MQKSQLRALKVQIFNSFYFKKETKIAPWGWVPGPDDCGSIDSINLPLL